MLIIYSKLIFNGNGYIQYVVKVFNYSKNIVKFIHNNRNIWYNSLRLNKR